MTGHVSDRAVNVHATAVVLGTTGFLFIGPSGTGKTAAALSCLSAAKAEGLFAALIADDQVLVSMMLGQVVARRPTSIAGLAEIRGAGIVPVDTIPVAVMDFAILPVKPPYDPRLPPENETFCLPSGDFLPLLRLPLCGELNSFNILRRLLPRNAGFKDNRAF